MNEKYINFNKIKDLTDIKISDNYNIEEYFITNFSDILKSELDDLTLEHYTKIITCLYSYGFVIPSNVQQLCTIPMIKQKDCIIQASSGCGKTAGFLTPLMCRIDTNLKETQGLILCHSRELVQQIYNISKDLFKDLNISIAMHIGGIKKEYNRNNILSNNYKEQVIICSPGRLNDLLGNDGKKKQFINLNYLKMLVLDEADELLSHSFVDSIKSLFTNHIAKDVQICVFSATIPTHILTLTNNFIREDGIRITIPEQKVNLDGIFQYKVQCDKEDIKMVILIELLQRLKNYVIIVFVNNKLVIDNIVDELKKNNINALGIHSNKEQEDRFKIKNDFEKNGGVLITTDLFARGIDITTISFVFNYDIPLIGETYIHRIGRTGRYGRKGYAINLITNNTENKLIEYIHKYNINIIELPHDFDKNLKF
jgi:ATP-dependent RNA helicase